MVGLGDRIHYGIWKKGRVVGHGTSEARDESECQSGDDAGIILNHRQMRKKWVRQQNHQALAAPGTVERKLLMRKATGENK